MSKKIMVVDDSRIVEVQIKKMLEDTCYEVAAYCSSGEEALQQYDAVNPDIVTMDIIMPGMDGLEAAQAILEEHPDAKIIMMSSLAYEDTFYEAKLIGAKGFIVKPFDQGQMLSMFEKVLWE